MNFKKRVNGSWVNIPCYTYKTSTEAVENPLYSDGTAITAYTIKGNTVQNDTPTPDNPVEVNGVGERTINIYDGTTSATNTRLSTSGTGTYAVQGWSVSSFIPINPSTNYCTNLSTQSYYCLYNENKDFLVGGIISKANPSPRTYADAKFIRFDFPTDSLPEVQLSEGRLGQDFEPYGYKIPISSGGVTTNIYLGSTASIRNVKKAMFSGGDSEGWYLQSINSYGIANFALNSAISPLKWIDTQRLLWVCNRFLPQSSLIADTNTEGIMLNQYNACFVRINSSTVSTTAAFKTWLRNNPIVVYYVLANAETAAVNEPLMKIGDYADTLSNAAQIPTTEGANSITVDTTVQPSEFTATWTGWHDSSVKEWDGSDWQ